MGGPTPTRHTLDTLAHLPPSGKLAEDLVKVRKQLDDCRAENVSLFEKVGEHLLPSVTMCFAVSYRSLSASRNVFPLSPDGHLPAALIAPTSPPACTCTAYRCGTSSGTASSRRRRAAAPSWSRLMGQGSGSPR